jgi:hypothetical protein
MVLLLFVPSPSAQAADIYGPVEYGGHEYYLLSPQTWDEAESEAVALGGHLVSINDQAEQVFVLALTDAVGGGGWWIGFTDQGHDDDWQWVSGEMVTYTNWASSEPNNFGGNESCGVMERAWSGLWNDMACFRVLYAIAEVSAPTFSCVGFEPPMAVGPVTVRGNRAMPLKAVVVDSDGFEISDLDVSAPPVIQVAFEGIGGSSVVDVTGDAVPVGMGTDGNEFEYNLADGVWQFNLKTKNYTAEGTYTITMVSGDASEYTIDPACQAAFERKN